MGLATLVFAVGVASLLAACVMAVLALRCYLREGVRAAMAELAGPSRGEGGRGSEVQRFAVPASREAATRVELLGPRSPGLPVDAATAGDAVAQPGVQRLQGSTKSVEVSTSEDAITQVEVHRSDGSVDAMAPGEAISRLEVHESRMSGCSVAAATPGDAITQLDPAVSSDASTRVETAVTRRRGDHAVDGEERRYG